MDELFKGRRAQAPAGSAASYLRPADAGERDAGKAEIMLGAAAAASKNTALVKAIASFLALTPEIREALAAATEVIDGAPLITDIEALIEGRLRMIASRGKLTIAREHLEGWWPRICAALQAEMPGCDSRARLEVEQKLDDNRRQVAAYAGLAPTPWQSGSVNREQGLAIGMTPK
jgi:transposase